MKKAIIAALAVVLLIVCLIVARWADGNTKVPSTSPSKTQPSSSATVPNTTTNDFENGLGWG